MRIYLLCLAFCSLAHGLSLTACVSSEKPTDTVTQEDITTFIVGNDETHEKKETLSEWQEKQGYASVVCWTGEMMIVRLKVYGAVTHLDGVWRWSTGGRGEEPYLQYEVDGRCRVVHHRAPKK